MTNEMKLLNLQLRLRKIMMRRDAMKTPGVINRLKSEINTLKKELNK